MKTKIEVSIHKELPDFTLDVEFVKTGGIIALVGPSGSGKTLTLKAIAGLLTPDYGKIAVGERVLFEKKSGQTQRHAIVDVPAYRRRAGFVFQNYALFPHLTVAQNIAYGLRFLGKADRNERVLELLALVQLSHKAAVRPYDLSGGEQQRIALARALAPKPNLLLLDEPLSALDAPLRFALGNQLRELHEVTKVPMLLVTHDPTEADRLADEQVQITGGHQ